MSVFWMIYVGSCVLFLLVYGLHHARPTADREFYAELAGHALVSILPVVNTLYAVVYLLAWVADASVAWNGFRKSHGYR